MSESPAGAFDAAAFVPALQEYLEVAKDANRNFLLGWLRSAPPSLQQPRRMLRPFPLLPASITRIRPEILPYLAATNIHTHTTTPHHPFSCPPPPRPSACPRSLLDSLPDVDLASHLPALLPGLLALLSDGSAEIRSACSKLLQVRLQGRHRVAVAVLPQAALSVTLSVLMANTTWRRVPWLFTGSCSASGPTLTLLLLSNPIGCRSCWWRCS